MGADDFQGLPGLPLLEGLADTIDGLKVVLDRGKNLRIYGLVGFPVVLAPLAVAEDNEADVEVAQHLGRDLPGVGSGGVRAHILGPENNLALLNQLGSGGQGSEGWADANLDGGLGTHRGMDLPD